MRDAAATILTLEQVLMISLYYVAILAGSITDLARPSASPSVCPVQLLRRKQEQA